ncbi:MAG: rhodanese-related sulfurtransferase [Neisseriaceae bacterium]|nr:rhodanese-related sulfurtransferase [Neisseriaceae bacterium]MBP6861846.1 rhodanese-related sulfurtransferase [Neisseriaceae bacterium]
MPAATESTPIQTAERQPWTVAALYQFCPVADPEALQSQLVALLADAQICGTLIVAGEGINGTIAGSREGIDRVHQFLLAAGFDHLEYKESLSDDKPFRKAKVKLKKEIVTLGVAVAPLDRVGHYLEPQEWHEFIQRDDVIVIDTRNDYEYKAGTFKNAIDPKTESFREFPQYVAEHLADAKDKKIAMFCTGGIRCEKSTSLLLQEGFKEVYHLKGGVLNYLEQMPAEDSLWEGECYVFDHRTVVTHGVVEGKGSKCHACGWALVPEEVALPSYEHGVSCVYCIDKTTDQQKAGFRMRQSQLDKAGKKYL